MRPLGYIRPAGLILALAAWSLHVVGAGVETGDIPRRYEAQPEASQIRINGTSNLHDWQVTEGQIQGWVELGAPVGAPGPLPASALTAIHLTVPVASLASGKDGMDRRMREGLLADAHPAVRFHMTGAEDAATDPPTITITGDLTVAGSVQRLSLPLTARIEESGTLVLSANVPLKMTAFGIRPPRALMGALRTGDDVTVEVTWSLTPDASAQED